MISHDKIAIVSLAIRFPGCDDNLGQFWDNVARGVDCSHDVPTDRWLLSPAACVRPGGPHPDSVPHARGYFLNPFKCDSKRWNVPADILHELDVLFHTILDTGHRAWNSARTSNLDRRKVGVVLGNICLPTVKASELAREYIGGKVPSKKTNPWNRRVAGLPAGLLAKSLGLGGCSFTLDAACSSSLYAIKLACDELLAGRADAMLAGGANGADSLYTQMGFAQLRALSQSGRCSPFDRAADGLLVGEGAGIVILKRAADAIRDGDEILGLICGWGLSNDLHGNLLAPAVEGQLRAMQSAYDRAGWKPSDVELIECHATGTPVGDAVEFDSLRQLWGDTEWTEGQCVIGSVKSTVGHLLTGAGAAALAKILCAFAARQRPPQANFFEAGPGLQLRQSPFRILQQTEEWTPKKPTAPRRAAISGFGFGGVNAHLLLEEYVGQPLSPTTTVVVPPRESTEPIAVIGMATRIGPWSGLRQFQEHVLGTPRSYSPSTRKYGWEGVAEPCSPGNYMTEITVPLARFRIPPKEIEEMLPQQLLMLLTAADALEDAGLTNRLDDTRTGAYIGLGLDMNTTNYHIRWSTLADRQPMGPPLTADRTMGALGSIAASRIARSFGLGGPCHTVCSEETSSNRALELAVRSLRLQELDRVIVGGVDLLGDPRIVLTQSPNRTPGEGAAAVVLKRLADAERDGDRIYAIIRGVGSAIGSGVETVVPDSATVASSLMRSCRDANIDPSTIGHIECGFSGDCDEDQAEREAIAAVLEAKQRDYPLSIGTVHEQIGHIGFTSGLSSFIKACIAVHTQIIPPCNEDIPRCHISISPRFWLVDDTHGPRRAATCTTSTDGTVSHVIIDEYPKHVTDRQPLGDRSEAILAVAADDPDGLLSQLDQLENLANSRDADSIEPLAREWFTRHHGHGCLAISFVSRTAVELLEQIGLAAKSLRRNPYLPLPNSASQDHSSFRDRIFYNPHPIGPDAKVAFVFPGSGNHYPGMGQELSVHFPEVLRRQQKENARLHSQYAPDKFWADQIPDTTNAKQYLFGQVALGTLTSDLLALLGIPVHVMIGLSLGESAGLFGLRIWNDRDEMLERIETSTLFGTDLDPPYNSARQYWDWPHDESFDWMSGVIGTPPNIIRERIGDRRHVYLLIINTPNECVIGGLQADVQSLVSELGAPFIPLKGVTLAHCEAGRPVETRYRELHTLPTDSSKALTIFSGAWGRPYSPTTELCADSITAGLVEPIDFPRAVEAAYHSGVRVFLEMGPGNSATRMIAAILGQRPHLARAVTAPRQNSVSLVMRTLAALVSERIPVDLSALYGTQAASDISRRSSLPTTAAITLPVGCLPVVQPLNGEVQEQCPHSAGPKTETVVPDRIVASIHKPTDISIPYTPSIDPRQPPVSQPVFDLSAFVSACVDTQTASGEAHETFLRLQAGFTTLGAAVLQLHSRFEYTLSLPSPSSVSLVSSDVPRSLNTQQCFEFARGKIGNVLGPIFAEVDSYPTRVRLPDGPLMLVDHILAIEGEPKSLARGRVVTEHHVHSDRWYLDAGRIPTCIAVEAGQADLFLSGFLGIDFRTQGRAVYRLIDAVVKFHRGLPTVGETILYDIHIDEFVHQGDAWLFRFRFESTVNGEPLLTMSNGVAGFFTGEALASGQGIVHTKLDKQPLPRQRPADWVNLVPLALCSLGPDEVSALRRGDLVTAFGHDFGQARLSSPMKLPGGMLRLLDRVPTIDPQGGRFQLGFVRAEYDIHPDDWFLTCHFVDDMVMPGTLMYECCLHTLRVLLMRMGWIGEEGEVATEPVPGVSSRLKCRGQVIASTKVVAYEVSIKELGYGPEPFCIADALMYADGKPIVEITNMSLRMAGLSRQKLEQIWNYSGTSTTSTGTTSTRILYGPESILAFSNGNPSEAFGAPYRIFDRDRTIARLPGPPFQFLDRVIDVIGEPFVLKAGASCVCQYDVPADAWYFGANRCERMPFSVLLEIALQPCGWLAAYCGSALTSDIDLSFRNLGGKATQYLPVGTGVGTLTVKSTMTNVSKSGGMIIQHYEMDVSSNSGTVYHGTTYFGFFAKDALANQVGMPQAKVPFLTLDQRARAETGELPHAPPFPAPMLRMVDRIDGYLPSGGRAGLGLVQGRIAVDPSFWFFQAHFYQDPVWPGSLGLESFLQLLKYAAWRRWGSPPESGWQTVAIRHPHEWIYRGQVVPTDHEVIVVLEITAVDESNRRLTADGFLTVDGRIIYQMLGFTLE